LRPSADTSTLVQTAVLGLRLIYQGGFSFAKAGVMLMDLSDEGVEQGELSLEDERLEQAKPAHCAQLMQTLDRLNQRYGRGTLSVASSGITTQHKIWSMRQERLTPRYTTAWADMPIARA
jgi:DNA polymerase V